MILRAAAAPAPRGVRFRDSASRDRTARFLGARRRNRSGTVPAQAARASGDSRREARGLLSEPSPSSANEGGAREDLDRSQ